MALCVEMSEIFIYLKIVISFDKSEFKQERNNDVTNQSKKEHTII